MVSSITGSDAADIALSFGSKLILIEDSTLGTIQCDATSLVRGPANIACPR